MENKKDDIKELNEKIMETVVFMKHLVNEPSIATVLTGIDKDRYFAENLLSIYVAEKWLNTVKKRMETSAGKDVVKKVTELCNALTVE